MLPSLWFKVQQWAKPAVQLLCDTQLCVYKDNSELGKIQSKHFGTISLLPPCILNAVVLPETYAYLTKLFTMPVLMYFYPAAWMWIPKIPTLWEYMAIWLDFSYCRDSQMEYLSELPFISLHLNETKMIF